MVGIYHIHWVVKLKVHINKQINKSLTNSALEIQFLARCHHKTSVVSSAEAVMYQTLAHKFKVLVTKQQVLTNC